MNILMTGGTGLLGDYMVRNKPKKIKLTLTHMDIDRYSYYYGFPKINRYKNVDIVRRDAGSITSMEKLFKEKEPEIVIHAASYSSPDEVERNPEQFIENIHMTHNIASLCKKYKKRMIFISSNAVYRGMYHQYSEWTERLPVNEYGLSKLIGENITEYVSGTIVRLTMMYGNLKIFNRARSNLALQVIENVNNKKHMWLFDDIFCRPLYAAQAAKSIYAICETKEHRVFNIAGYETVSMYDFGLRVCSVYGLKSRWLNPVREERVRKNKRMQQLYGMNISAVRPQDTSFNTSRMLSTLGIMPLNLMQGLLAMRNEK